MWEKEKVKGIYRKTDMKDKEKKIRKKDSETDTKEKEIQIWKVQKKNFKRTKRKEN